MRSSRECTRPRGPYQPVRRFRPSLRAEQTLRDGRGRWTACWGLTSCLRRTTVFGERISSRSEALPSAARRKEAGARRCLWAPSSVAGVPGRVPGGPWVHSVSHFCLQSPRGSQAPRAQWPRELVNGCPGQCRPPPENACADWTDRELQAGRQSGPGPGSGTAGVHALGKGAAVCVCPTSGLLTLTPSRPSRLQVICGPDTN
ncbi:uncharacterized protein LOC125151181 isoform X2 [Prionailurus viverrinus]|uniref:uncharacterized protein LOC125151181 isoform X2 n=1 Tax=Prionailurus viverrinus TaxID=61388 RepID=UPI001FF2B09C|nr:uncharacterized protein LOC125151181 isoform X2 [Prionailurus viverrinus]